MRDALHVKSKLEVQSSGTTPNMMCRHAGSEYGLVDGRQQLHQPLVDDGPKTAQFLDMPRRMAIAKPADW